MNKAPSLRLNRFVAAATGLSRRAADAAISRGEVEVNQRRASLGQVVTDTDHIKLAGRPLIARETLTVMLNKPPGYVVSRRRQGRSPTIYDLLPKELRRLKPIGRLDRQSEGLLLLTSDGQLAQGLMHPSVGKVKRYQVSLDRPLTVTARDQLLSGVKLSDGLSRLKVVHTRDAVITIELAEGRNRQIRRTLGAIGYQVERLQRLSIGRYRLGRLPLGGWRQVRN